MTTDSRICIICIPYNRYLVAVENHESLIGS